MSTAPTEIRHHPSHSGGRITLFGISPVLPLNETSACSGADELAVASLGEKSRSILAQHISAHHSHLQAQEQNKSAQKKELVAIKFHGTTYGNETNSLEHDVRCTRNCAGRISRLCEHRTNAEVDSIQPLPRGVVPVVGLPTQKTNLAVGIVLAALAVAAFAYRLPTGLPAARKGDRARCAARLRPSHLPARPDPRQ